MKKIFTLSLATAIITFFTLSFTACSDDDDQSAKPAVTLTEVGYENSGIGHPGTDLHLEADIVAEGIIKRIDIEIHQEEGGTCEIEQAYTDGKYVGVRNTTFHEHIDIPADAPLGNYHLHFTVTDNEGQQTTVGHELLLTEGGEEEEHEHEH